MTKIIKWVKAAGVAGVGGGVAGAFTAMMDPSKYHFPHDLGSGKLWKYFGMGAVIAFGGLLIRSPFGQSVMKTYKDAQAQLAQSKADIEQAKADLKSATKLEGL